MNASASALAPAVFDWPLDAATAAVVDWLRSDGHWTPAARVRLDSRLVQPGDVFVAAPGGATDGRHYIAQALAAGAAAVLWDDAGGYCWPAQWSQVPAYCLPQAHRRIGPLVAELLGHPSQRMLVTAFTGTNGKTTASHWLAQLNEADGTPCAVAGTLGAGRFGSQALQAIGLTTPEATDLQGLLADWAGAGVRAVSLEASSIGLAVGRLDGTSIQTAVFTNLSRDHLDFHGDFERYRAAKARLFSWPGLVSAVVNCDDDAAEQMLTAAPSAVQRIGYRIESGRHSALPSARVDGWLRASRIEALDAGGYRFEVQGDWGRGSVSLRAPGRFNISNALAVAGAALANGMGFEQVLAGLSQLQAVAGRMQMLGLPNAPLVVVDYAHTADALAQVLGALRPLARARAGRLVCVFGAGGNRDPGKRESMGEAAALAADRLVITTDNPRHEDPVSIAQAILDGAQRVVGALEVALEPDRRSAIGTAIADAQVSDVILIAGKGHENYQEIAGERLPFDDFEEARRALARRVGDAT